MPVSKQEFKNGKLHSKIEEEIVSFLTERNDRAFTSQEIMEGIHYHTEFNTPEIAKMSTFAVADFTTFLHHLVEREKIKMKVVRGRMYFIAGRNGLAECPKCGEEIVATKTWKMTGRPNKKGERIQLQIGLFECPKHGFFRKALDKQKIPASTRAESRKKKKKKPSTKQARKKTSSRRVQRKKKQKTWTLA
jgi:hypothetical protein